MAMLLFAGSWLVGVRALAQIMERLPVLRASLKVAETAGEPTWSFWIAITAAFGAIVAGSLLLLGTLFGVLMLEGSQVMVDELGIAVEHNALPAPLARKLGAGRLPWKRVTQLQRSGPFFVLRGGPNPGGPKDPTLRFLMVDELERLVLTILERSPNLKYDD
jgi:hypothetical protein